jgi:hypothetical protein
MLLAALFEAWDARLVYTIKRPVVVSLYNLRSAVVIVRIVKGTARSRRSRRVRRSPATVALKEETES